jgi:hypothetical protein
MSSSDLPRPCDLSLCISPIKSTSSTPASPGASPLTHTDNYSDDPKAPDFEPPARPKSTPFPQQEIAIALPRLSNTFEPSSPSCPITAGSMMLNDDFETLRSPFSELPQEIHECILDHIFGVRASIVSTTSTSRSWSSVLRHSRRKQLSDVALISNTYRDLVQSRIFKHSTNLCAKEALQTDICNS